MYCLKSVFKRTYKRPLFLFLVKCFTFKITLSAWNATVTERSCSKNCPGSLAEHFCLFPTFLYAVLAIFSKCKSPLHVNFNKVKATSRMGLCVVCEYACAPVRRYRKWCVVALHITGKVTGHWKGKIGVGWSGSF